MISGFLPPTIDLEPFIERIWWCRSGPGERVSMPLLCPGVGAELFVQLGRPFVANGMPVPGSHLLSARTAPIDLAPQDSVDLVAIRFRAGALRHFIPAPVQDVPEGILDAEVLWGATVAPLREQLGELRDFRAQARRLTDWCRAQLHAQQKPDRTMDHALRALYETLGSTSLDTVVKASGLGPRQFQRRFRAIMGIGPKCFQRLARLYKLVRRKALSPGGAYLGDALDLGFYDQAHAIHEFRNLTRTTPGAFLREITRRTHFYNPPRPRGI